MAQKISITIGNKGTLVELHAGKKVLQSLFIGEFNQEEVEEIGKFFNANQKQNVYIFLDTVAQNYNHKTFPAVNRLDLIPLVNRKFEQEIPKDDLKGKLFIDRDPGSKKWNYLFISASVDAPVKQWLNFLDTVPNNVVGIYMLPLEMKNFVDRIIKPIRMQRKDQKSRWVLAIVQNKTSELRQVAFYNGSFIFTRVLPYDADPGQFGGMLRNDILRTVEYLKRFSNTFSMDDLTIITVTEKTLKDAIGDIKVSTATFLKYTPFEASETLGLEKYTNPEETHCDTLLSRFFVSRNSFILKFMTPGMGLGSRLFVLTKYMNYGVFGAAAILLILWISMIGISLGNRAMVKKINEEVANNRRILRDRSEKEYGVEGESIDEIIDVCSIAESIKRGTRYPATLFDKYYNVQNGLALVYNVVWSLESFDYLRINPSIEVKSIFDASILNPDGNVDQLFSKYQKLIDNLKSEFTGQTVNFSAGPTNISSQTNYYSFPVRLEIRYRENTRTGGGS